MPPSHCAFCDRHNPDGSKFCNECGSPLHLAPCPHCEAVNDVVARACYRCGVELAAPPEPSAFVAAAVDLDAVATRAHAPDPLNALAYAGATAGTRTPVDRGEVAEAPLPSAVAEAALPSAVAEAAPPSPAVTVANSIVLPRDDVRLAVAQDMAATARRRTIRSAAFIVVVVALVGVAYFGHVSSSSIGNWFEAMKTAVGIVASTGPRVESDAAADSAPGRDKSEPVSTAQPSEAVAPPPPALAAEAGAGSSSTVDSMLPASPAANAPEASGSPQADAPIPPAPPAAAEAVNEPSAAAARVAEPAKAAPKPQSSRKSKARSSRQQKRARG